MAEDRRQMMGLNMEFLNIKNSGASKKKPVNIVLAITVTLMGIFMSLILCPEAVYYGDFFYVLSILICLYTILTSKMKPQKIGGFILIAIDIMMMVINYF